MANTWRVVANGIPFTTFNESMFAIHNANASAVVKIYRVILLNNQTTGFTGSQGLLHLQRLTGATIITGNWTFTPVPMDSNNSALSGITCASKILALTPTTREVFERVAWSNDEPSLAAGNIDEFETFTPYSTIWDSAYNNAVVEPLTLRNGQTLSLVNYGFASTLPANAGLIDVITEFTVE